MFLASLVGRIKQMRLGIGTVNLPNTHRVRVAAEIAMLDHRLDGTFNFGISPDGLPSDSEAFGKLDKNRLDMLVERIDQVLEIWRSEPPDNIRGKYWTVSTARTALPELGQGIQPKPLQRPHPPIICTVVAPFSKGVTQAVSRGREPISTNFLMPAWVRSQWPSYVEGCRQGGRSADPANWRVAMSILVADNAATARDYAIGPVSPYRFYYFKLVQKMTWAYRAELFEKDGTAPDSSVTVDGVCDDLIIHGTPAAVAGKIAAFRDEVGDFGTPLFVGHDWADPVQARRSIVLTAEQVMPRLNAMLR